MKPKIITVIIQPDPVALARELAARAVDGSR